MEPWSVDLIWKAIGLEDRVQKCFYKINLGKSKSQTDLYHLFLCICFYLSVSI